MKNKRNVCFKNHALIQIYVYIEINYEKRQSIHGRNETYCL